MSQREVPAWLRWWPFNGKSAFYAERVIRYGAAGGVIIGLAAWVNSVVLIRQMRMVASEVTDSMMVAVRTQGRDLDEVKHGQDASKKQMEAILKGQEILVDVTLRGVYDKSDIDRFRMLAQIEHDRERRDRMAEDARIRVHLARLDSLSRRRR